MQHTQTKNSWGGARKGAGRPKGSVGTMDKVTVTELIRTLARKTENQTYEDILIEDFLRARENNNAEIVAKYHSLILLKVMKNLNKVESKENSLKARQEALAEALLTTT